MSTTTKPTTEEILAAAEIVTHFAAANWPPADSRLTVDVVNYDGQDRNPALRGVYLSVRLTTSNGAYATMLAARLFGTADPDGVDEYPDEGIRVTRWRDSLLIGLDWTCPLTDESAEPAEPEMDASDVQDVIDDRGRSEFKDSEDRR